MDGGTIALDGPAHELLRDPRVAALYLGGHVKTPTTLIPSEAR
jgi:hypothetical protein